jgi:formylmethanofuran dehydrogenase subunit E
MTQRNNPDLPRVGGLSWREFVDKAGGFHGYPAPGLLLGGIMVDLARKRLEEMFPGRQVLFEALAESAACLPDAVQLLTPCTAGNQRLRVRDFGRYALTLHDKYTGEGARVHLDAGKMRAYPEFYNWFMGISSRKDQDEERLREEIRLGGAASCIVSPALVPEVLRRKEHKGKNSCCPICGEPYPVSHGGICKGCRAAVASFSLTEAPALKAVDTEEAVGRVLLHDMTQVIPGVSKDRAFAAGQTLESGDVQRLRGMGRGRVFLHEDLPDARDWVHENEACLAFARALCGPGVGLEPEPREGKARLLAARPGLFVADAAGLESFNLVPGVMCATLHHGSLMEEGRLVAGVSSIPLYLPRGIFQAALVFLEEKPLLSVLPLRRAKVAVLVTGTEVFQGLVRDEFTRVIREKIEALGCGLVYSEIVPDALESVKEGVRRCLESGADLLVVTAGLSVDPDDITRKALLESGLGKEVFGFPMMPGAMSLYGRLGQTQVLGAPACALHHKTTIIDLLLPRLLAGLEITRREAAALSHGGLCRHCRDCVYPHCPFGK